MRVHNICRGLRISADSPMMDEILEDDRLFSFFNYFSHIIYQHEENTHEMYYSDQLSWIKNILDISRTQDHNGAVWRANNPKKKGKKGTEFNMKGGETFGNVMAPARWKKIMDAMKERADQDQQSAKDLIGEAVDIFEQNALKWTHNKAEA